MRVVWVWRDVWEWTGSAIRIARIFTNGILKQEGTEKTEGWQENGWQENGVYRTEWRERSCGKKMSDEGNGNEGTVVLSRRDMVKIAQLFNVG